MVKSPNEPPAKKLIDNANRLVKELSDRDSKIARHIAAVPTADDPARLSALRDERASILTDLIDNVDQLLDAHDACDDEKEEWGRSGPSATKDAALVALAKHREAITNALARPLAELQRAVKKFHDDTDASVSVAYNMANDEKKPSRFYTGINPSVFKESVTADEQTRTLASITQVMISKADAAREVNRLLDLTSARRIAEEMDIVTYHAEATRLFDRIRAEFNEISEEFQDDYQSKILAEQTKIAQSREEIAQFEKIAARLTGRRVPGFALAESQKRAAEANRFLDRYRQFAEYEKKCADLMRDDFGSESSVKAYKKATRSHAERIEKQGIFASYWTIGTGLAAAALVAIVLVFLDNNLLLKNWTIPLVLAAGALMYGLSVKFGKDARNAHMQDLRETLHARALKTRDEGKTGAQAGPRSEETNATRAAAVLKMRANPYFEFPKVNWKGSPEKHSEPAGPNVVAGTAARSNDPRQKQGYQSDEDKHSILARELADDRWSSHERNMWKRNLGCLAAIVAVPLAVSLLSGTWGPTKTFAFVSRTSDQGTCVLDRGRVLLATGGSYYVARSADSDVTELAKSSVLLIQPDAQQPALADCAVPSACANECRHGDVQAAASSMIVPVIIESTAASQEGPSFTTMIYPGGGEVREPEGQPFVLFPLFGPVSGATSKIYGQNGIDTSAEAFHFGFTQLQNPPLSSAAETLIQRIKDGYGACMNAKDDGAIAPKLLLEVKGYASEKWLGKKLSDKQEILNLYLAEGRRHAIIDRLSDAFGDSQLVIGNMPAKVKFNGLADIDPGKLSDGFEFQTYDDMKKSLDTWLIQPAGGPAPDWKEELFARSVVVIVKESPCTSTDRKAG